MRVIKVLSTVAACLVAAASAHAADAVKPDAAPSAVVQDAGQSGKPAAQTPKTPVTERRFDPPPVPEFMLRKPGKPLTIEEMKRQADEASEREKARRARAAEGAARANPVSAPEANPTGNPSR